MSSELILDHQSNTINGFVFFASLFAYNFQRLIGADFRGSHSLRHQWIQKNKRVLWLLTAVSGIVALALSTQLSKNCLLLLLPLGVIVLLYPIPIFYSRGKAYRLREVPGIKIFLIAAVWTLVSVGLLAIEKKLAWSLDLGLLLAQRFFFVFAITIPFDIRDLKYDNKALKTIPVVFGEEKARMVGFISLALYELGVIAQYLVGNSLSISAFIALLCVSGISAYLLLKTTSKKGEYYFAFWVEGASLMMYVFLIIVQLFF